MSSAFSAWSKVRSARTAVATAAASLRSPLGAAGKLKLAAGLGGPFVSETDGDGDTDGAGDGEAEEERIDAPSLVAGTDDAGVSGASVVGPCG